MVPLEGRTVILVDDGIATGGTARAAVQVARARGARRVVVAVPVAAPDVVQLLGRDADEVIAVQTPEYLMAIGGWYQDFRQTTDEELIQVLDQATARQLAKQADPPVSRVDEDVTIVADGHELGGHLDIPEGALGIVLFAHGSGSSRYSPRNRSVASFLNQGRLATLLFDLLTPTEANDRSLVFDIPLLAQRLRAATAWLRDVPQARDLPIGYFGASTGAGAALWAAADPEASIAAVVSRGGRPDLAIPRLADVRAPTLLIVGGYDSLVLDLNEEAARHLRCERRVAVVPGASHLFEEPGTLAQVAQLARDWFVQHFEPAVAPAEHTERPR
jgi:putative phosphoribosyl transferase